jgi:hypothetical protein
MWQCAWSAALCVVKYIKRWQCTWSTTLCVVKRKKEVTTYISLHKELYFMYIFTCFFYNSLHTVLYFMYIVTSFLYFTTHRAALHVHCHLFFMFRYRAVLHVHCHLFFMFWNIKKRWLCTWSTAVSYEISKRGDNVHEVQLCVVKY